jgi:hypothetical protein
VDDPTIASGYDAARATIEEDTMSTGRIWDDWGNAIPAPDSPGRISGQPAAPGFRPATGRRVADTRRRNRAANRRARAYRQSARRAGR